ncbi:hypothetical protein GDO78_006018 [Eleutherodactylus coqui]|uniref:Thyroid transcription factor 1-associated protein 26 n=1 Tax=Eleutherodactylus coqui TaxID=57060 RepID=A0A8J6FM97_ELECQ|nr:hypothetical protein GDO78_006018 [Eleutherodactylus coqui]
MATTSGSVVSAQYRKGGRNVSGKSGAGSDGERRGAAFVGKGGGNVKRKWRPNQEQKKFEGSAKEGRGFALWRKNKVQSDYKKLQRKRRTNTKAVTYSDHYPEHLRHLYLAEEEKLNREEKERRSARKTPETVEEQTEEEVVVIPKKKFKKKTSNQKAKEEYEQVQLKRAKKREEAENNRRKREEALRLHKQRKMETFKVLCSKTKKGQPNFNVQMDYLLKKIQSKS